MLRPFPLLVLKDFKLSGCFYYESIDKGYISSLNLQFLDNAIY